MWSYVCGQCHVEYYFAGENKVLTFPWDNGFTINDIEAYYDEVGHVDWKHAETGAPMLKMQHPEFEMWNTSLHARSGVSCADCHMPYMRVGGVKVSDHWVRSPLNDVGAACGTCHNWPEEELEDRILDIQDTTAGLLRPGRRPAVVTGCHSRGERNGLTDEDRRPYRSSGPRRCAGTGLVENSTGYSPQEAARVWPSRLTGASGGTVTRAAIAEKAARRRGKDSEQLSAVSYR
jgi:nitrite reductase (cytochrome c-552)